MKGSFNLVGALDSARKSGRNKGVTFIESSDHEKFITYDKLFDLATRMLGFLQSKGLNKGSELVFQLESNEQFLVTFWACILGKIIPVPLSVSGKEEHKLKLFKVWRQLNNAYLISDAKNLSRIGEMAHDEYDQTSQVDPTHSYIDIDEANDWVEKGTATSGIRSEDIAYIQFSSGSTGDPKGVTLTHGNLVANTLDIVERSNMNSSDRALSWMPLTHDMGLICFHLSAIEAGIDQFIMPTGLYIRRPLLWMEKASLHKATLLYSPNFGYQYLLSAHNPSQSYNWDLSNIKLIYNGAEPISVALCEQFVDRLATYGLRKKAIAPGYGLAEASVGVCISHYADDIKSYHLDREKTSIGDAVIELEDNGIDFVEVGPPLESVGVRIADHNDKDLPERHVGHIQIKGPNVTSGYYNQEEATKKLFTDDGWVRTGDLGFLANGRLVVTGRLKNIIIIGGQNYYPQDIELAVQTIEGIELGMAVACGVRSDDQVTDELVVFILFKKKTEAFLPIIQQVRTAIIDKVGLEADQVLAVRSIPKTTSGKVQHYKLIKEYRAGGFDKQIEEIQNLSGSNRQGVVQENLENSLQQMFKNALGLPLKLDENFLTLGLNSLQLTRAIARISRNFGVRISIKDIFANPTVNHLSQYLKGQSQTTSAPIEMVGDDRSFPVTPAQSRFWALSKLNKGSSSLNIPLAFDLRGDVDENQLQYAFRKLLERHESLRTVFVQEEEALRQKVLPPSDIHSAVKVLDWSEYQNASDNQSKLDAIVNNTFDLSNGPLIKVYLIHIDHWRSIFLLVAHHLIFDGWSVGVFLKEISAFYRSEPLPQLSPGKHRRIQFRDFVNWYKNERTEANLERCRSYWLSKLEGLEPVELNLKRPYPSRSDSKKTPLRYHLPSKVMERLRALCAEKEVTVFMMLVASVKLLLLKYSGQKDIAIGTDSSGRNHPELEDQIGLFINTLVLRTQCQNEWTFSDLLQAVKKTVLEAFDNEAYPFESLQKELSRTGNANDTLFSILVLYQNFNLEDYRPNLGKEIEVSTYDVGVDACLTDLQFEFLQYDDHITLALNFNKEIYDATDMERLLQSYSNILNAIIDNADLGLQAYKLLPETALIPELNRLSSDAAHYEAISKQFERRVAQVPDAIALVVGGHELTYAELNTKSNQLSHYLSTRLNIQKEETVGILLPRSEWVIISMLAVLKSGAAYVPIDVEYPVDRVLFMLKDADPRCVISTSDSYNIDLESVTPVLIDQLANELDQQENHNPANTPSPEELAYVIYTSGTTGRPKGVMIEHRSLSDYVKTFSDYFKITSEDVVVQQSAIVFDTSVEEIYPTLLAAGKLVLVEDGGRNIDQLVQDIIEHEVTVLSTTPLVINELNQRSGQLKTLRTIISGGDKLQNNHIDQLIGVTNLYNTYGPSESTVCATYHQITAVDNASIIGEPIRNRNILILNEELDAVPTGVIGEICIAGEGLARGYLNQAQLTKDKFVHITGLNDLRIYKTGDLGRWTEEGEIEFIGRLDDQVKLRGYRVEPQEIRNVILEGLSVDDAYVLVRELNGHNHLVAYLKATNLPDHDEIRRVLAKKLPSYMIPDYFVAVESFPMTVNGKLNVTLLPSPRDYIANETVAIDDVHSVGIARIWQEVLALDQLDYNQNFFELGGHSIKAAQVIARIQSMFNVKVEFPDIFQYPTIQELSQLVSSKRQTVVADIEPIERRPYYDVSHAQKRLWVLDQLEDKLKAYNMVWAYQLEGTLSVEAMEKALLYLIWRHEALRTTFTAINGEPKQFVHELEDIDFKIAHQTCNDTSSVEQLVQAISEEGFDLSAGPLVKAWLVNTGTNQHIFLLSIHHIIADGWSMDIFLSEFTKAYSAFIQDEEVSLPHLDIQYKDYTVWQNKLLGSESFEQDRSYWLNQFKGEIPVLDLPSDKKRPAINTYGGSLYSDFLDADLQEKVVTFSRKNSVTVFMTLLAAFKLLLHRYTAQTDIIIGTPTTGRSRKELEEQIGFYINTLPLRTRFDGSQNFIELLQSVINTVLDASKHQNYPFDKLVDELDLKKDLSRSPLFDVMIGWQQRNLNQDHQFEFEGVIARPYEIQRKVSQFDLSIDFIDLNDGLQILVEYKTDLFTQDWVERLVQNFKHTLLKAIEASSDRLSEIDILSDEEKNALNGYTNGNHLPQANVTIHQKFEEQVSLAPDHIAVVYGNESLTYQELNNKANQLANLLLDHGVKPQDRIGLLMDRSEQMIVAILAVLKSGAAYVPIDAEYPKERIQYLLENSQVGVVIKDTQQLYDLPEHVDLIDLEHYPGSLDEYANETPDIHIDPENLAYVIYTSGSTGQPKGVMVEHRNLVNITEAWKAVYKLDEFQVNLLQMASMSFDVFFGDVCRTLLTGGKMIICPSDLRTEPDQLYDLVSNHKISIFESTPALIKPLMDHIHDHQLDYSFLKILILGSDSLHRSDYNELLLRFGKAIRIINTYGTTETAIDSTYFEQNTSLDPNSLSGIAPIGRPFQNTSVHILNEQGQIQPIGVWGVICIGGKGVSRGYWENPEMTAVKFVNNPFEEQERMYKTGDIGRWLPDGNVEFKGRDDDQIKLRGYRIELGEIESAALESESIQQVAVSAMGVGDDMQLICYYVSTDNIAPQHLREYLSEKLPAHMIPNRYMSMQELPLSHNGKVDRKRLPAIDSVNLPEHFVAPENETQRHLASIWSDILKVEKVGLTDNFFELGGQSLKAIRIISRIHQELNAEIRLRDIFTKPTLGQIAELINDRSSTFAPIPQVPVAPGYALSSSQRRLWILDQMGVTGAAYNLGGYYKLSGALDEARFIASIESLVRRHEILRTVFKTEGTEVRQVVLDAENSGFSVERVDLPNAGEADLEGLVSEERSRLFDLAAGPLLHARLVRLGGEGYLFLITLHHIISDGWSVDVMIKELIQLYQGATLPELSIQYKDYAGWQQSQLTGKSYDRARAYWHGQFSGDIPVLELPTVHKRPKEKTYNGDTASYQLPLTLKNGLSDLSQQQGASLFMTLLSITKLLCYRYTGQEDLTIGTAVAGRNHKDLEEQLGFYVNTLALRSQIAPGWAFTDLLAAVKKTVLDAQSHEHYPFDALVDELDLARDLSRNPLFD
ncbi:MAG: amino acid adenylation domain-containing protein, partial [Bacteroidota bacterium]